MADQTFVSTAVYSTVLCTVMADQIFVATHDV